MNKKNIAIVSLLKPLHDPRHYERFALSLAKTNKYEINIIANGEKKPDAANISFHTIGSHKRKHLPRLTLHWKAYKLITKIKPDLLIICTVELIPFAIIYSIISKVKIIYDIQENYRLNFRYLTEYNWFHKYFLSYLISVLEKVSVLFFDHYFLAEKCYQTQLNFFKSNYTILENKTAISTPEKPNFFLNKRPLHFLFSGTISSYSGIAFILQFIEAIAVKKDGYQMTIIGQVHNNKICQQLDQIEDPHIHLKVSKYPIPHDQIIQEIRKADIGLITYSESVVNAEKVPTKLYEYAALGLPYLVEKNSYWYEVGQEVGGAIPFDFHNPTPEFIKNIDHAITNAFKNNNQERALWSTEEDKLLKSIDTLL
ncbi:MAG: hypothetical protein ACFHWX_11165 [Bacteroidota bacterium]